MNLVSSYQIWYDGAGMHDVRAAANAQLSARLADTAANHRVAEYFLRMIDYAGANQKKVNNFKMQNHQVKSTRTLDYITHIHAKCKEDIESRWGAELSGDEVNEILFAETLQRELDKIKPKETTVNLRLG